MSTEIATQNKNQNQIAVGNRGLQFRTLDDLWRFSTAVVQSRLAPKEFDTVQKVVIAIEYGAEFGFPPMMALQSIAVINGRPCIWGDAVPALARSSGECEYIREWMDGEGDSRVAYCETLRKGDPKPTVRSFSVADAKQAGLWQTQAVVTRRGREGGTYEKDNDSPWFRYPQRMLQMRARAWCLRDAYADAMRGLQVREEVEDYADSSVPAEMVEPPKVKLLSEIEDAPIPDEPVVDVIDAEPAVDEPAEAPSDEINPLAESLADRINAAETELELTAIAGDVKKALRAKSITAEQAAGLSRLVEGKRVEITGI